MPNGELMKVVSLVGLNSKYRNGLFFLGGALIACGTLYYLSDKRCARLEKSMTALEETYKPMCMLIEQQAFEIKSLAARINEFSNHQAEFKNYLMQVDARNRAANPNA